MFIIVDLPDPDGPMTATKSPAATSKSTPRRAWKLATPVPKVLVTPRSWIRGSPGPAGAAPGASPTGTLRCEFAGDHRCTLVQRVASDFSQRAVRIAGRD